MSFARYRVENVIGLLLIVWAFFSQNSQCHGPCHGYKIRFIQRYQCGKRRVESGIERLRKMQIARRYRWGPSAGNPQVVRTAIWTAQFAGSITIAGHGEVTCRKVRQILDRGRECRYYITMEVDCQRLFTDNVRLWLRCAGMRPLRSGLELRGNSNFDRCIQWQFRSAHGDARVSAGVAEYFDEQVTGAVDDPGLAGPAWAG